MTFSKRLRAYLIGIVLGIGLVLVIFRGRTSVFSSWLPEKRVLLEISEKKMSASSLAACQLNCLGLATGDIQSQMGKKTEVDFSASNLEGKKREYKLVQEIKGITTVLVVDIQDSTTTLLKLSSSKVQDCNCPE